MITAIALITVELLILAGLAVVRRQDVKRQREFNKAVISLVLDIGIEKKNRDTP